MAATYEPIASTTLGSAAADITFSSIPGTYTDLVLVIETQAVNGGTVAGGRIRFNGDTGSNYSITRLAGTGSLAYSDRVSNDTAAVVRISGNSVSAFTPVIYHIMNYSSASVYKTGLVTSSESLSLITKGVLLWRSTTAITSITIFSAAGVNLNTGTTAALYGIKAA